MLESADVAITTVTSILIMTSIVGNSLVCAVVLRNRDMRIPINYLIVNLAAADIIYSIFLIPMVILSHISTHPEGTSGKVLCTFVTDGILAWIGAASSDITLIAIAFERFFAVVYPHGSKGKLNMRKVKIIIPGSWIFAFILQIPQLINKKFDKEINPHFCIYAWPEKWIPKAFFLIWLSFFVISSVLMTGLYARVVYVLWYKRPNCNLSNQQQGVLRVRKRVTLMVAIVTAIFVFCWGIDSAMHVLQDVASYKLGPLAVPVAHTLVMFNSAVNPFAYALINQRFREKIKGMMQCCSTANARSNRAANEHEFVNISEISTQMTRTGASNTID